MILYHFPENQLKTNWSLNYNYSFFWKCLDFYIICVNDKKKKNLAHFPAMIYDTTTKVKQSILEPNSQTLANYQKWNTDLFKDTMYLSQIYHTKTLFSVDGIIWRFTEENQSQYYHAKMFSVIFAHFLYKQKKFKNLTF